ncbi:MAG: hypothetical protein JST44_19510 [Cyanobacteria bacterium SZAS LIN-5]|nr:hypothetical protein [Cyanobacteria bacterium SZAS LIN-5]
MPDDPSRIAKLENDVRSNNMDGLRHDLAAIAMSVPPAEYRSILEGYNKQAQADSLPQLQITYDDHSGDKVVGGDNDFVQVAKIDTGSGDGAVFGPTDVFNADNVNALKTFNDTFAKAHPDLIDELTTLEAYGMQPCDHEKFREAFNFFKTHNNADIVTLIDGYLDAANQSGGILQKIWREDRSDGRPYVVHFDGSFPANQEGVLGFPENPIESATMVGLGITGDLAGALQTSVERPFESP